MKHMPLRECGYAIGFVAILLVLYGGAYIAMMQRTERISGFMFEGKIAEISVRLEYRCGGDTSAAFFGPAHEIDRRLRPEMWRNELIRVSKKGMRAVKVHVVEVEDSP